jgi:hypothetical protein
MQGQKVEIVSNVTIATNKSKTYLQEEEFVIASGQMYYCRCDLFVFLLWDSKLELMIDSIDSIDSFYDNHSGNLRSCEACALIVKILDNRAIHGTALANLDITFRGSHVGR